MGHRYSTKYRIFFFLGGGGQSTKKQWWEQSLHLIVVVMGGGGSQGYLLRRLPGLPGYHGNQVVGGQVDHKQEKTACQSRDCHN